MVSNRISREDRSPGWLRFNVTRPPQRSRDLVLTDDAKAEWVHDPNGVKVVAQDGIDGPYSRLPGLVAESIVGAGGADSVKSFDLASILRYTLTAEEHKVYSLNVWILDKRQEPRFLII